MVHGVGVGVGDGVGLGVGVGIGEGVGVSVGVGVGVGVSVGVGVGVSVGVGVGVGVGARGTKLGSSAGTDVKAISPPGATPLPCRIAPGSAKTMPLGPLSSMKVPFA